jgi:hypothetical protein
MHRRRNFGRQRVIIVHKAYGKGGSALEKDPRDFSIVMVKKKRTPGLRAKREYALFRIQGLSIMKDKLC